MSKKVKRPKKLGFRMVVRHPASETDTGMRPEIQERNAEQMADADGHEILGGWDSMQGEAMAVLQLRDGISAKTAIEILKKMVKAIEVNGDTLLACPGEYGWGPFDRETLKFENYFPGLTDGSDPLI